MSGIPRMGKIGLKNEKYNKAFEKHIKRSNTLVSLTEKMFNRKMLWTAGVLFVTFQEEIAPSSKTNQGENSYMEKKYFLANTKKRW